MNKIITLEKGALWQPSVTLKTTTESFLKHTKVGDVIHMEKDISIKETQYVKIFINGKDATELFNEHNNKNPDRKNLSYGTIRDKLSLALSFGFIESQVPFSKKTDWYNRNIKFNVLNNAGQIEKTIEDWINNKEIKKDGHKFLTTFFFSRFCLNEPIIADKTLRSIGIEGVKDISLYFNSSGKNGKNIYKLKGYSQLFSKEKDKEIYNKYKDKIEYAKDVKNEINYIKNKFSKSLKTFSLNFNNLDKLKKWIQPGCFPNNPFSAIKKTIGENKEFKMTLIKTNGKYSLLLDSQPEIHQKSVGTIFWNLWGFLLLGAIEADEELLKHNSEKSFVEYFINKKVDIKKSKEGFFSAQAKKNIDLIGSIDGKIREITSKYFVTSFFLWMHRNGHSGEYFDQEPKGANLRSTSAIEILNIINYNSKKEDSNSLLNDMIKNTSDKLTDKEIKKIAINKIVQQKRSDFADNVNSYYSKMMAKIEGYSSIHKRVFPIIEKAHIYEVRWSKEESNFEEIADANNCILLEPNIHRLWDKRLILLNSDGRFINPNGEETEWQITEKISDLKAEYINRRLSRDLDIIQIKK